GFAIPLLLVGDKALVGGSEAAKDDGGGGGALVVGDGVGFDNPFTVCGVGHLGAGQVVDLALQGLAVADLEFHGPGGVHPGGILGHHAAIGADKAVAAGFGPQLGGEGADGVHRVIVSRAAKKRQPAGEGQAPGVIGSNAQGVANIEYGNGKAAVEIDKVQVVDADTGKLQRFLCRQGGGRRLAQILPLHYPALGEVGVTVEIDPLAL